MAATITSAYNRLAAEDRADGLRMLAQRVQGMRYGSPVADRILNIGDWSQYWPYINGQARYTGEMGDGGESGEMANIDEVVLIDSDDLPEAERRRIRNEQETGVWDGQARLTA